MAALSEEMNYAFTAVELPLHADGKPRTEDIGPKMAELKAAGIDFAFTIGRDKFLQPSDAALNRDNHQDLRDLKTTC